jgi:type IX secretion system PorP/SprF family membrane protein
MSQGFVATNFFNPAAVGFGDNNQFQSFYRNQFSGVGNPFRTVGVGVDFALFKNESNDYNNNFGLGLQGVSEQVLNGILQTNEITLSLANRVFLNQDKTSYLALGISSTLITRNIDRSALTFGDQYNSGRLFNSTSMETIGDFPAKFSTNGGLLYAYTSPDMFIQAGGSTYYINRSSNTQIYGNVNQSFQFISTFNLEKKLSDNNTFFVHANYQNRLEAEFFYVGGAIGLPIQSYNEKNNRFYVGCFYRSKDAFVPYIGLLHHKYKMGVTYDIYNNKLTQSNLHPQTLEFTLSTYLSRNITKNLKTIFN